MSKNWRDEFDDRQRKQIEWAEKYTNETDADGKPLWKHGANGHNDLVIIGAMAALLDKNEALNAALNKAIFGYDDAHGATLCAKYGLNVNDPQSILDAIKRFGDDEYRGHFNFAHIVISDRNIDRFSIEWCIGQGKQGENLSDPALENATQIDRDCMAFLHELLKASDQVLQDALFIYDGEDDE